MSFEGEYEDKKGRKNTVKIIEQGPAILIDNKNKGLTFSTEDRIFTLRHAGGKAFLYMPIRGLAK